MIKEKLSIPFKQLATAVVAAPPERSVHANSVVGADGAAQLAKVPHRPQAEFQV
jgi:hypothetical protein